MTIKKGCDLTNQERDEEGFEGEEKVENVQINQSFDAKMQQFDKWDWPMMEFPNFHSHPPDACLDCSRFFKHTVLTT